MVTRCPQCQTSFKVTDEHLKIANGAVRCGSCLHVFQARQHWMNPDNVPPPLSASSFGKLNFDQSAIDNESADELLGDLDIRIPEAELNKPAKPAQPAQPAKKIAEIGDDDRISDDTPLEEDEEVTAVHHASFISGPVSSTTEMSEEPEDEDDYSSLFDAAPAEQESASFEDLLEGAFDEAAEYDDSNAVDESGLGDEETETWTEELPTGHDDFTGEQEEPFDEPAGDLEEPSGDLEEPADDSSDQESEVSSASRAEPPRRRPPVSDPFAAREPSQNKVVFGEDRASLIAHIEPPPVVFPDHRNKQQTNPVKTLLIQIAASIVLALVFVGQYTFFNFDELAKNENRRHSMETLCKYAGCKLPPLESWRNMRISSLVVRKHPNNENGLIIDAILLNTSNYPRPFPRLEMYFSEEDKLPFASRRFTPNEYLSGEMSGKTEIPPGQPVHLALEIVNPGPKAVNWSMQVTREVE
jgi:predicted Zn finger-like uncharacterized protein